MPVVRTSAPDNYPITLDSAKAMAVIGYDADDDLVMMAIEAAANEIDAVQGWLGRALITQTLALKLPHFPARIDLPFPPFQSVSSIAYTDEDGDAQTLAADQYTVKTLTDTGSSFIVPAFDSNNLKVSWPNTRAQEDAVVVTYLAGYGDNTADIPHIIRWWLQMRVATLYEHREELIVGAPVARVPWMDNMLENYRVR